MSLSCELQVVAVVYEYTEFRVPPPPPITFPARLSQHGEFAAFLCLQEPTTAYDPGLHLYSACAASVEPGFADQLLSDGRGLVGILINGWTVKAATVP